MEVETFTATIDYGYKAVGLVSDGGFTIDADDNGQMKATMTRFSDGPFVAGWSGDNTGSASLTQQSRGGTDVTKLSGGGATIPLPIAGLPKVSLIVDLQTCTFRLIGGATLNVRRTEPNGRMTNADEIVAMVQFAGSLGFWRNGLVDFGGSIPPHSVPWGALNLNSAAVMPLGFVSALLQGDASVGQGTGGYLVIVKK